MTRPDAALARFKAALDARYGETGAQFVVWLAEDHDGDPSVYVRIVFPEESPVFGRFGYRLAMRQKVNEEAAESGMGGLVYISFRSAAEAEAEDALLARLT